MTGVTLELDLDRWRQHLNTVAAATPGLVPVAKGNGYGFGLARLAAEATLLNADAVAVGLAAEVAVIRGNFAGDLVILQPWRPFDGRDPALLSDQTVITTVSRIEDLTTIAGQTAVATDDAPAAKPRIIIEVLTSMHRHGIPVTDLAGVAPHLANVRFEGWAIHLPLADEGRYLEAERLARAALAVASGPLWLSHLPADDATILAHQVGGAGNDPVPIRLRVGTRLWLGDPEAIRTTATVVDVRPVRRGTRAGYRQHKINRDGWLVVVAGGTAHGIGMAAPSSAASTRQRLIALAEGGLEASGRALSPYTIGGRKRWFLEPPHMQTSLLLLPRNVIPPAVGDQIPVELRLTTALVDEITEVHITSSS